MQYQKDHPDTMQDMGEGEDAAILAKKVAYMKGQAKAAYEALVPLKQTQANLGAYLTKSGKMGDYKKWAEVQAQKAYEANQAELAKIQEELKEKHEKEVAEQKAEHAAKAERNREHRDELMRMRFQYDIQREQDNTMVNVVRYGGFSQNQWWNDGYYDVPGPHNNRFAPSPGLPSPGLPRMR